MASRFNQLVRSLAIGIIVPHQIYIAVS